MSQVIRHAKGKIRPANQPRPSMLHIERAGTGVVGWLVHRYRKYRVSRAARSNVERAKWWHRRPVMQVWLGLAILGSLILAARLGWAAYVVYLGRPTVIEEYCKTASTCDVLTGFFTPFLTVVTAAAIFWIGRVSWVTWPWMRRAIKNPRDLVPTAGTIIGEIVGRDELCKVIMQILRDRENRRPYLIVGGVGTGKTAVIVKLTQMLAEKKAIPVPIRLRDAGDNLDFSEMARTQFCAEVNSRVVPVGFAERVWTQLRKDDRVVVLADGLEEAFAGGKPERDRDNLIRQAIQRAYEEKLPLVIASRPHHPLESTQAAILELEPLSEEAALDYIQNTNPAQDAHRLDWIVETADVADAPLYLQITRQLHEKGLLEHLSGYERGRQLDTRGVDRSALRWRILETWRKALISGFLHPDMAVSSREREEAIEYISALACIGLLQDRIEVSFEDLTGESNTASPFPPIPQRASKGDGKNNHPRLWKALREKIPNLPPNAGSRHYISLLSLAATRGEQLGLVEMRGTGVRFQHSIVQAYLGSRFLSALEPEELEAALNEPGRELLIALVLDSRRAIAAAGARSAAHPAPHRLGTVTPWHRNDPGHSCQVQAARVACLLRAAADHQDAKAFDLYAGALEIDSVLVKPHHHDIAKELKAQWPSITIDDPRTIEEAKLGVVHRFGEALREVGNRHYATPAYRPFFDIACSEDSYPVRVAIAQEIGIGGDEAFRQLCRGHRDPWAEHETRAAQLRRVERSTAASYERKYRQTLKVRHPETESERADRDEKVHNIRGGALREKAKDRNELWQESVMRAWLAPMLLGSVGDEYRDEATDYLDAWLSNVGKRPAGDGKAPLPISMEVALAQGFKGAANRRKSHPNASKESRGDLMDRAEQMLERSRFWFSQLTLIHALCLWSLPDRTAATLPSPAQRDDTGGQSRGSYDRPAVGKKTTGAVDTVAHWLAIAGSKRTADRTALNGTAWEQEAEHPFIAAAGDLAALALESGHPERFIWIDESGVMNKVGSKPARPVDYRKHSLWIPPSAGWSVLERHAQQLLADVLILLNLTEGTGQPEDRERRLERANRADLPMCLTRDRTPLRPGTTIGMPGMKERESSCLQGCPFELCPYPPSGALPRAELSEAFCRRQQTMLGHRVLPRLHRRTAPWQGMTVTELRRFWEEMASRTRPHDPAGISETDPPR